MATKKKKKAAKRKAAKRKPAKKKAAKRKPAKKKAAKKKAAKRKPRKKTPNHKPGRKKIAKRRTSKKSIDLVVTKNPRRVFTLEGGRKRWSDTYDVKLNGRLVGAVQAGTPRAAMTKAKALVRMSI